MATPPHETLLGRIVPEILAAADPSVLVQRALAGREPRGPCRLLAVGKAAPAMASSALDTLGDRVLSAVVVGPAGAWGVPPPDPGTAGHTRQIEADHPTPTARNVQAASLVRDFVGATGADEILLFLLSGGASAMLCLPRNPLTLADLAAVTEALFRAGAPIAELNAVRKHCEALKGGGLAAARGRGGAGSIITLILSDVLGDRLDVIGSGPTAPDPTTFADALAVLQRRGAAGASPEVTALLRRGAEGAEPETVKADAPLWDRVENRVIGNNRLAVAAAAAASEAAGYPVLRRREAVEGEAADIGRELAAEAMALAEERPGRRAAIIWGGETTVTVGDATGLGGRNQELALSGAIELAGVEGITMLSLATDGRDGPTDAAGAVVDGSTAPAIRGAGVDPRDALRRHDSYHALDRAGALLRTGPTGTNVNDLMLALIG